MKKRLTGFYMHQISWIDEDLPLLWILMMIYFYCFGSALETSASWHTFGQVYFGQKCCSKSSNLLFPSSLVSSAHFARAGDDVCTMFIKDEIWM
jgi:hypothetical protein